MVVNSKSISKPTVISSVTRGVQSRQSSTQPAAIAIRYAEPEDKSTLQRLLTHPSIVYWTAELPYRPVAQLYERFQPSEYQYTLVAVGVRGVMGMIAVQIYPQPRLSHIGHIGPVAVHPDCHGQGIGSTLMQAVIDLADQWLNLHRLDLFVYADNDPAIGLYKKFGFVSEGILRDYAFRAGRYADIHSMSRIRHA